jgi:Tfp pilus assembly PilM family ATPase
MFFAAHAINIEQILIAGEIAEQNVSIENIPISVANPFINMEIASHIDRESLNKIAHLMALSCGLALWQFDYG